MATSVTSTGITFPDASSQTSAAGFATGTAILFQQTAAPTGWTKVTTYNDYALRIVSGSASTGGSVGFTTAFASGLSAGATTLSTAQMPSHSHGTSVTIYRTQGCGCPPGRFTYNYQYSNPATSPLTVSSNGSDNSHTHSLPSFAVQYVDVIIATKN